MRDKRHSKDLDGVCSVTLVTLFVALIENGILISMFNTLT